jgi:hypothetical protein
MATPENNSWIDTINGLVLEEVENHIHSNRRSIELYQGSQFKTRKKQSFKTQCATLIAFFMLKLILIW